MFAPAPAPLALKARLTRARGWGASGARRTLRNVRPAQILIGSKDRYLKKNSVKFSLDCRGFIYQSCISTYLSLLYCCTACGSQCLVQCVFSHISCLCQSVLGVVSWSWGGPHSLHISQHPFLPRISFTGHYSDLGIIFFKRQETRRLPEQNQFLSVS